MNVAELIALASVRSGKTRGQLAEEMQLGNQTKLSNMANGTRDFHASEIIYLAAEADLDPVLTLMELEQQKRPHLAQAWTRAIGNRRKPATTQSS